MISFISLNSVVKKIQNKVFGWLYARIKKEFVSPNFAITRYLSRQIESLRKLCQRNNHAPQNKIVPEDTLLLVYDLIATVPVIEDSINQKADVVNSFGLDSGQRGYNFVEKHQFLSWKHDTFENIRDGFLEFVDSFPPLEKSGNVDKGVTCCE
tara:strand:- start:548 stop:1006 length:459 start_codon:yes stop_codon:yes gene_type:complete